MLMMKTMGRWLSLLLVVGLGLKSVDADWVYDFVGPAPADWAVVSSTLPAAGSSATLVDTLESGN